LDETAVLELFNRSSWSQASKAQMRSCCWLFRSNVQWSKSFVVDLQSSDYFQFRFFN